MELENFILSVISFLNGFIHITIRHIERHRINGIHLKNLTTDDLQEFVLYLQNAGHLDTPEQSLSAKTIRNVLNMIHKALAHAVGRQLIYHNPADFVELPRVITPDIRVLTEEEMHRFVGAMEGDSLQIALVLMLFCGLRLGECCALTHSDVLCTDDIYYLNISKSLNRISNFEAKAGEPKTILRVQETKTSKSKRQVPLLPEVADKLLAHIQWQKEQVAQSYGSLTTDDLQEFILFLQSAGQLDANKSLSAKTIRKILNMVHKALEHAVGRQLIYHNPADYVQLPKVITPEMRVLTETEISRFVSAMEGDSLQIALILMLFCGLRLGECCALTHDDVCCDDGIHYLSITKSLNRISNFEARDGEPKTLLRIQETKTSKGKRQVPLLPEVADKVLSHMCW